MEISSNSSVFKCRYAESEGDHLLFKRVRSSGELQLLETRFSSQLGDLIDLHLSQQHSIPVFLAAVITDLFSRRTFDTVEDPDDDDEEEEGGEEEEDVVEPEEEEADDDEEEEEEGEDDEMPEPQAGDDDDPICID